jgi:hypothetical protein
VGERECAPGGEWRRGEEGLEVAEVGMAGRGLLSVLRDESRCAILSVGCRGEEGGRGEVRQRKVGAARSHVAQTMLAGKRRRSRNRTMGEDMLG